MRLKQSTTPPTKPWVDTKNYTDYLKIGNAYFKGAQTNQFAANTTNCFNRTLYVIYKQLYIYQWRLYYGSF